METSQLSFAERILDLSMMGTYIHDLTKGQNIFINECYTEITGFTLEDLNGMTNEAFFRLFHPDEKEMINNHINKVIASSGRETTEIIYRFKHKDGHWIWCLSRDKVFERDDTGKPLQLLGAFIDITERQELLRSNEDLRKKIIEKNRKLELRNQELNQLTYVASHDLQEPLRTIRGYIDVIKEDHPEDLTEEVAYYLEKVSNAATRMTRLIKGLLVHSRLGKKIDFKVLNIPTILGDVFQDLTNKIKSSDARIEFLNDLSIDICGLEIEVKQLFQNLISNAIKFKKENEAPHIRINYEELTQHHKFSVSDNGVGIEANSLGKIFTIFQRLNYEVEGNGIGLANCKKIVELHQGAIWVESQVGKGSTFFFTLKKDLSA